jgi:hypothetical protein
VDQQLQSLVLVATAFKVTASAQTDYAAQSTFFAGQLLNTVVRTLPLVIKTIRLAVMLVASRFLSTPHARNQG